MQEIRSEERVATGGLCHVAIDVSDLGRSLRFYTGMFNLDVVSQTPKVAHLRTPGGRDSFFLFQADGPVDLPAAGLTHFHFGFRIDDPNFDRALKYVREHNVKIHPNPARAPGRFVYFEDPDGYVVQLEPGDCE